MVDRRHIGTRAMLLSYGRLLRSPERNPYATLIALYLDAVHESDTPADQMASAPTEIDLVRQYLMMRPDALFGGSTSYGEGLMISKARQLFRLNDKVFDRYLQEIDFYRTIKFPDLVMKDTNTIIQKWAIGASNLEEFHQLLQCTFDGTERYVEWKRVFADI